MTAAHTIELSHDDYEISEPQALIKHPVVSVLMLAYNHGKYLAQAIESVLAQQADLPIELLIGEDFSTDNTREIARRYQAAYPETVRIITSDKNVGSSLNHRRILLEARGEFHAYLDGDDYWLPNKLIRQVTYIREHPECAAVYTNALTIDAGGNKLGLFNDVGDEQFELGALFSRGNFLNNSSVLYRAVSRPAILGIDAPSIDYRGHLLLARAGYLAHLSMPLVTYRIGSVGSMMTNGNHRVRQLYWEAMMSVPRELITDHDMACGIADFLRRVFFRSIRTRQIALLREWIPRAYAASPYGAIRTSLLTAVSIIRMACKELIGRLRMDAQGNPIKVLYRR
jgi:glycosyltransferase involved in cell wall biosynthesis